MKCQFYINESHLFPSIPDLIAYHKLNSGGMITRLRRSITEANAPVNVGMGLDVWEVQQSDFKIVKELGGGNVTGVFKGYLTVAIKILKKGSEAYSVRYSVFIIQTPCSPLLGTSFSPIIGTPFS